MYGMINCSWKLDALPGARHWRCEREEERYNWCTTNHLSQLQPQSHLLPCWCCCCFSIHAAVQDSLSTGSAATMRSVPSFLFSFLDISQLKPAGAGGNTRALAKLVFQIIIARVLCYLIAVSRDAGIYTTLLVGSFVFSFSLFLPNVYEYNVHVSYPPQI